MTADRKSGDSEHLGGPEEEAYYQELMSKRVPEATRRALHVRPEEVGSQEWFNGVAQYWGEARRARHVQIREIVTRSGLPLNTLRYLEGGWALEDEVNGDILPQYAQALGDPKLYDEFRRQFQTPEWHAGRDLRRDRGFLRRT